MGGTEGEVDSAREVVTVAAVPSRGGEEAAAAGAAEAAGARERDEIAVNNEEEKKRMQICLEGKNAAHFFLRRSGGENAKRLSLSLSLSLCLPLFLSNSKGLSFCSLHPMDSARAILAAVSVAAAVLAERAVR